MPENNNLTVEQFVRTGAKNFDSEETKQAFIQRRQQNKNVGSPIRSGNFAAGEYKDRLVRGSTTSLGESFDFENFQAYQQSASEKWQRGLTKFAGKVGLYTAGGLGSLFYSLPNAIANGSLSAFYDNDFVKFLDKQEGKLDENFRNYYTTAERDYNVFKSMGTANFWANDFLGGMAFVVGAVTTEAIASAITAATLGGGAGIQATATARLINKATKLLNKANESTKVGEVGLRSLSNINRFTNGLRDSAVIGRQLITGAGYESSVEAYHFMEEAKANFLKDFEERNGRQPNQQELAEQMDKIYQSGNALFAGNMALVGGTNMLTLPKTFGIKLTNVPKGGVINKLISGADDSVIGSARNVTRAGAGSKWELAYDSWSKAKKIGFGAKEILKRPFYEGIVEEGGQGFMSRAALDYTAKGYSSDGAANAYTLWDAMGTAFSQTYADGSNNEFWKEVAIGMILGGMGAPTMSKNIWQGSAIQSYRESLKGIEKARQFVNDMNEGDVAPRLKASIKASVGIYEDTKEMEKALEEGDMLRAKNAENSLLFRSISARHKAGNAQTYKEDMRESINNMSDEEFSEMFGYSDYTSEQIAERKAKTLEAFENKVDSVVDAIKIAEGIVGSRDLKGEEYTLGSAEVIEALAYSIESSRNADMREAEMAKEYSELIKEPVDKIIEASRLPANINLSKTWIKKYETEKELKEKWIKEREKLDTTSEDKAVQKRLDYVNKKIAEHEQKLARRIEEKHALEVSSNEGYNYNIDTLTTALEAMTDIYKKNKETIDIKPETVEQIRNLHGDLQRVAAQRNEFVQEIQALMSREGRKAFADDVRQIEKDSFKITKDALIGRYKTGILEDLMVSDPEKAQEIAAEAMAAREDSATTTAEGVASQATNLNFQTSEFDKKHRESVENFNKDVKSFVEGPKTIKTYKDIIGKLKNYIKAFNQLAAQDPDVDNSTKLKELAENLSELVDKFNVELTTLEAFDTTGKEKILNDGVGSLVRLITKEGKERDDAIKLLIDANKDRRRDFNKLLNIRRFEYKEASNEPSTPKNAAGGEITGTKITIKRGDGKRYGYALYYGDKKIGGITRPDRFLYDGVQLNVDNDGELAALGIPAEEYDAFRAYYYKSLELFNKVDEDNAPTAEEILDVLDIKVNTGSWSYTSNDEDIPRKTLKEFFDEGSYSIKVGNKEGVLVERGGNYYLYTGEDTMEDVTRRVQKIDRVLQSKGIIPKIRSQYKVVYPYGNSYQALGLDYPVADTYDAAELTDELESAAENLQNLTQEELDERAGSSTFVYEELPMFITLQHKDNVSSRIHMDASIRRNKLEDGTFGETYFYLKATSVDESSRKMYFQGVITKDSSGDFVVKNNQEIYSLTPETLLDAINTRFRGESKNNKFNFAEFLLDNSGNLLVNAVSIKKRIDNNARVGELEFSALPNEGDRVFLAPAKQVFKDITYKKKVKEVHQESQKTEVEEEKTKKPGKSKVEATFKSSKTVDRNAFSKAFRSGTHTLEDFPLGSIAPPFGQSPAAYIVSVDNENKPQLLDESDLAEQLYMSVMNGLDPFAKGKFNQIYWAALEEIGFTVDPNGKILKPNGEVYRYMTEELDLSLIEGYDFSSMVKDDAAKPGEAETEEVPYKDAEELTETEIKDILRGNVEDSIDTDNVEEDDDKLDFSLNGLKGANIKNIDEAVKILSQYLDIKTEENPNGTITVEEISALQEAMSATGTPFGAFKAGIIYLDQNRATRGTAYHEAFHAVFNMLLTPQQRAEVFGEAAKRYGKPTNVQLAQLRASHPKFYKYTSKELTELYYEEKMADDFSDRAVEEESKTAIGRLFARIKKWINNLLNHQDNEIDLLFDNILSGQYRKVGSIEGVTPSEVRFQSLVTSNQVNKGRRIPARKFLTKAEGETLISRVAQSVVDSTTSTGSKLKDIDKAIEEVKAYYSYDNWEPLLVQVTKNGKLTTALRTRDKLQDISGALEIEDNIRVIKSEVVKIINTISPDLYDEVEDNDTPESYNDKYIGEDAGFNTVSRVIKSFILTTNYTQDEFGLELGRDVLREYEHNMPVNAYKVYYALQTALVNTNPEKMLSRIKYLSANNEELSAVYDRIVEKILKESEVDKPIEEFTLSELKSSNFFNAMSSNFRKTRLDISDVMYDVSTGIFRIISANSKDAATVQVGQWYEKLQRLLNGGKTYRDISKELTDLSLKYYPNFDDLQDSKAISEFVDTIDERVEALKKGLFDTLGMDLDLKYIKWSMIHDSLEDIKNYYDSLTEEGTTHPIKKQLQNLMELHSAFNTGITSLDANLQYGRSKINKSTIFGLVNSTEVILNSDYNNRNPYTVQSVDFDGGTSKRGGARTRMLSIAASNAIFDPTVRPTSYQNIEGKNIWDVVDYSFYFDNYEFFKTNDFKDYAVNIEDKTWQDLKTILLENNMKYPDHFVKMYHNSMLNNPIILSGDIASLFSKDATLKSIGGIRQTSLEADGSKGVNTSNKSTTQEGNTWKNSDPRTKILTILTHYVKQNESTKKENVEGETTNYMWNVNEAKSTTFLVELPKFKSTAGNKLSPTGVKHMTTLLEGELKNIALEVKNIDKVIKGETYNVPGYNYNESTDAYSFEDEGGEDLRAFKLNTFSFIKDINPGLHDRIINEARVGKVNLNEYKQDLEQVFNSFFTNLTEDTIERLKQADIGIIEGNNTSTILPTYFVKNSGTINKDRFLEFIVNDYINSVSFNNMLDANPFFGKKNFIDFVKRNAGKVGYGPSMGQGITEIAIIDDTENNVNGIDNADGQSYSTESWAYNVYMKELGKLANKEVVRILQKKRKGYSLDAKEVRTLMNNNAMSQSKKLVGKDHIVYLKTSVKEIQRSEVSYVENKADRKELDNLYEEVFELEKDFDPSDTNLKKLILQKYARINELWKPLDNKQALHYLLKDAETKGIGIVAHASAIKEAKPNVYNVPSDGNTYNLNAITFNNKFMREQVSTDNFKKEIVHGSQLIQLIWSEQNDNTEVSIGNKTFTVGQLKDVYRNYIAKRVELGLSSLKGSLFEQTPNGRLGKPLYDKLYKSFKKSIQTSNPDPWLNELFSTDVNNNPVYNPNFTGVSAKFFQMFLAYTSKDVLKHKVNGAKYTLVSDFGHKVLVDSNNNVIRTNQLRTREGYLRDSFSKLVANTRPLAYENGVAEAIVSENVAKLYNLKVGEEIPSYVAKQIGFRIPTQDKHSMIRLKIVDTLPAETMNAIIVHPNVIKYSGADFDIDSLFARLKSTYEGGFFGEYLESGDIAKAIAEIKNSKEISKKIKEEVINHKFDEYEDFFAEVENADNATEIDKAILDAEIKDTLKEEFIELRDGVYEAEGLYEDPKELKIKNPELYNKIVSNIEAFNSGRLESIQPLTKEEIDNTLFDIEFELINNEGNREIAETPASFESIKEVNSLWEANGIKSGLEELGSHHFLAKLNSMAANDAGNGGIGPIALFNIAVQNLIEFGAKLNDGDILGKDGFTFEMDNLGEQSSSEDILDEEGNPINTPKRNVRTNDKNSTIVSAMTDNPKYFYSITHNLNKNTVSLAGMLLSMGNDSNLVYSILKTNVFKELSNMLQRKSSATITEDEKRVISTRLNDPVKLNDYLLSLVGYNKNSKVSSPGITLENVLEALKYQQSAETSELNKESYDALIADIVSNVLVPVYTANQEIRAYTRILSLIKGYQANPDSINQLQDDLNALGFDLSADKNKVKLTYKEGSTLINWGDFLLKNEYVKTNIEAAASIKAYLGEYLITYSELGQEFINSLKDNAKTGSMFGNTKNSKIIRDFSSYIMLKAYRVKNAKKYNPMELLDDSLVVEYRNLLEETENPESPLYKNSFLLSLTTEGKFDRYKLLKSGQLNINTRTVRDKDISASLIDGFKALLLNKEYKPFASKLVKHLIMRDGLVYKNNSFLSSIDPTVLQPVIDPLNEVRDAFLSNDDTTIKKLFNMPAEALKREFVQLYLLDETNSSDRSFMFQYKSDSKKSGKYEKTINNLKGIIEKKINKKIDGSFIDNKNYNPLFVDYRGDKVFRNSVERIVEKITVQIPEINSSTFNKKSGVNYVNDFISELSDGTNKMFGMSKIESSSGKKVDAIGFPLVFTFKDGQHTANKAKGKTYRMVLKRVVTDPSETSKENPKWNKPSIKKGNTMVAGYKAEYEPMGTYESNFELFSTMGYDLADLEESYKEIQTEFLKRLQEKASEFEKAKEQVASEENDDIKTKEESISEETKSPKESIAESIGKKIKEEAKKELDLPKEVISGNRLMQAFSRAAIQRDAKDIEDDTECKVNQ